MCLDIDLDKHDLMYGSPVPGVSTYDIVVYKTFIELDSGLDSGIISLFMHSFVAKDVENLLNVRLTSDLDVNKIYEVNQGIHSYTSVDSAISIAIIIPKWEIFDKRNMIIAKCHIPAGSNYYFGLDNDIVSDNLIIDEVLYHIHNVQTHEVFIGRDDDDTLHMFSEKPIKIDGRWTSDSIHCKIPSSVCPYLQRGECYINKWIDFDIKDLIPINQ